MTEPPKTFASTLRELLKLADNTPDELVIETVGCLRAAEQERDAAVASREEAMRAAADIAAPALAQARAAATAADARADAAERRLAELQAANTQTIAREVAIANRLAITERAIGDAYREGRLLATHDADGNRVPSTSEAFLRTMSENHGADAMLAFIATMPALAPIGVRALHARDPLPRRDELTAEYVDELFKMGDSMGLDRDAVLAQAHAYLGTRSVKR